MSQSTTSGDDVVSGNKIFPLQFFREIRNSSPSFPKKRNYKEQQDGVDVSANTKQIQTKQKTFGDFFRKNDKQNKNFPKTDPTPDVVEQSFGSRGDTAQNLSCETSPDKFHSSNESIAKYQATWARSNLTKQDSFDFGPIDVGVSSHNGNSALPSNPSATLAKTGLWNKMTNRWRTRKSETIAMTTSHTTNWVKDTEARTQEVKKRSVTFDPKYSLYADPGKKRIKGQNSSSTSEPCSKKDSKKMKLAKSETVEGAANHYKRRFLLAKIFSRPSSPPHSNKREDNQNKMKQIVLSPNIREDDDGSTGGQKVGTEDVVTSETKEKSKTLLHLLRTNSDTSLLEIVSKRRKFAKQRKPITLGMYEHSNKLSEEIEVEFDRIGKRELSTRNDVETSVHEIQTSSFELLAPVGQTSTHFYDEVMDSIERNFRAKSTPDILNDDVNFNFFERPTNTRPISEEVDAKDDPTASPMMPLYPPPPPPHFQILLSNPPPIPPRNFCSVPQVDVPPSSDSKLEKDLQPICLARPSIAENHLIEDSKQILHAENHHSSQNSNHSKIVPDVSSSENQKRAEISNVDISVELIERQTTAASQSVFPAKAISSSGDSPLIQSKMSHHSYSIPDILPRESIRISPKNSLKHKTKHHHDTKEDTKEVTNLFLPRRNTVRFLNRAVDGTVDVSNSDLVTMRTQQESSMLSLTSNKNPGDPQKVQSVFGPMRLLRKKTTGAPEVSATGANMFGRKAQADVKKSAAKVLDLKKDTLTRLKHLRVVIESYDNIELKLFFEQFYSHIYFLFHEGFSNVEASLGQRASKAHREELDFMLFIFEKILIFLPEMIHKRWQVHSIGRIMKKLLHPGNSLKLRREGLRLFLIWYQILMENATEDCHNMFCSLVWGGKLSSGSSQDLDIFTIKTFHNSKASVPDIGPLIQPQSGDKTPSNLTRYFLEAVLYCMVSEVNKIEWTNKESRCFAFMFLFNKFKKFYLLQFFPDFNFNFSIYQPDLNLPDQRNLILSGKSMAPNTMVVCQEIIVKWFFTYCNYFASRYKRSGNPQTDHSSDATDPMSQGDDFQQNEIHPSSDLRVPLASDSNDQGGPGINNSTLSLGSSLVGAEKLTGGTSEQNDNVLEVVGENLAGFLVDDAAVQLVEEMLYSSRENINIVHEVFRQAFLWSNSDEEMNSTRRAVIAYKDWFWCAKMRLELPAFMEEGGNSDADLERSLTKYGSKQGNIQVRAGLQNVLKIFFTLSSNVFLTFFEVPKNSSDQNHLHALRLEKQVEICKRVLNIYRFSVTNLHMDFQTWEQLLLVLLKATSVVMSHDAPFTSHVPTLAKNLAEPLFKTLIVTWIKANMNFAVGTHLWQQFTSVLSSLTHWIDLIQEWAKVMDVMTRILSKFVYELSLNDLPLDRMTEQKVKRLKGTRGARVISKGRVCFNQGNEMDGDVRGKDKSCHDPPQTRVNNGSETSAVRQRSRSGDLSPLHSSGNNVVHASAAMSNTSGKAANYLSLPSGISGLSVSIVRSNSDNSLLLMASKRNKKSDTLAKEAFDVPKSGIDHSMPLWDREFQTSCENLQGHDTRLRPDNEENTVGATMSKKFQDVHNQEQNEEIATEFFEEKSFKAETHLAKMDDFSYASSRSGHDSESLGSAEVQRVTKVPYVSMLEQGNESLTGDRSDNEYLPEDGTQKRTQEETIDDVDDDEDVVDIVEEIAGNHCNGFEEKKDSLRPSFPDQNPSKCSHNVDDLGQSFLKANEDVASSFDSSSQQLEHLQVHLQTHVKGTSTSGWSPDLAAILWCRLLGSLGNINNIEEPSIHLAALECLSEIVDIFICVRDNQSVTLDNQSSPPPPKTVPPILYVSPWLFDSLCLGSKYQKSAMLSLKVLCKVTLRHHDVEISPEHLVRFYLCLHLGLLHSNEKATNILIRYCSPRFLSLAYPGFTLLFLDFIQAAESTLTLSNGSREVPRVHAMALLGNLMTYINYFHCRFPVLDPALNDPTLKAEGIDIKELLVNIIMKRALAEPKGRSRCVSLSCLGMYLYESMSSGSIPDKSDEITNILLSSLNLDDTFMSQMAASTLMLMADHIELMIEKGPKHVLRVLEGMTLTISMLFREVEVDKLKSTNNHFAKTINIILFVVLEWCMKIPLHFMVRMHDDSQNLQKSIPILGRVFRVLQEILLGTGNSPLLDPSCITDVSSTSQDEDGLSNTLSLSATQPSLCSTLAPMSSSTALSPLTSTSKVFSHDLNESKSLRSVVPEQHRKSLLWPHGSTLKNSLEIPEGGFNQIHLAAFVVLQHLVNYLGYFPFSKDNTQLCSSTQEHYDLVLYLQDKLGIDNLSSPELKNEEVLWSNVLDASDLQFFVLNGQTIMSMMELPMIEMSSLIENNGLIASYVSRSVPWCRFTFRDVSGKFTWDVASLHHLPATPTEDDECFTLPHPSPPCSPAFSPSSSSPFVVGDPVLASCEPAPREKYKPSTFSQQFLNTFALPLPTSMVSSFSFFSSTHFVTQKSSIQHSEDLLDSALSYIGLMSPECLFDPSQQLNIPWGPPAQISLTIEDQLSKIIDSQCDEVIAYLESHDCNSEFSHATSSTNHSISCQSQPEFWLFRRLFNSLGSFSWERRSHFDLICKNERFLRELKHLDNQRCQETHKIAVIYVGPGQEDKMSILSNQEGSQKFNLFIRSLGWMVNLRTHQGFMGGLQNNGSTGELAPYYCTSTKEVMFHVSTLMPGVTDEDKLRKLRHLGNDEVHIIWSEHSRDYRHGIIPTDFGDVLIIIYPLSSGMFRVQIKQKAGVPHFGPLFDEVILNSEVLTGLIRATAINAGNSLRSLKNLYQTHYESRYNQILNIAHHYKSLMTFEDFSFKVIAPSHQKGRTNLADESVNGQNASQQDSKSLKDASSTLQRKVSMPKAKKHPSKRHVAS